MLVLSRKPTERILIGELITVKVLSVSGNKVRLGIDAPAEVPVLRGELRPDENRLITAKRAALELVHH